MAAGVLVLLGTSLLPIFGWQFPWVTAHWVSGFALIAAVLLHAFRALFWNDIRSMLIGRVDVHDVLALARFNMRLSDVEPPRAGKYSPAQKLIHHAFTAVVLVALVTGAIMMAKIDTPWWDSNQYILSDATWGVIYVLHGLTALLLITMVMAHVYFALRPEKLRFTRSMISWLDHPRGISDVSRSATLAGQMSKAQQTGPEADLGARIEAIESGYEFLLAYAAQGRSTDRGGGAGGELRDYLGNMEQALTGLGDAARARAGQRGPALVAACGRVLRRSRGRCAKGAWGSPPGTRSERHQLAARGQSQRQHSCAGHADGSVRRRRGTQGKRLERELRMPANAPMGCPECPPSNRSAANRSALLAKG